MFAELDHMVDGKVKAREIIQHDDVIAVLDMMTEQELLALHGDGGNPRVHAAFIKAADDLGFLVGPEFRTEGTARLLTFEDAADHVGFEDYLEHYRGIEFNPYSYGR